MTASASPALARRSSSASASRNAGLAVYALYAAKAGWRQPLPGTVGPCERPASTERLAPPFVGEAALRKIDREPLPRQMRLSPAPRVATDVDHGRDAGRRQESGEFIGRARPVTDGSNHRPTAGEIEAEVRRSVVGVDRATRRRTRESSEWPDRSTTQMPTACS